ncbi:glycyl-radical enzyme activating protein [Anaerostipes sp.]|uniref:glycyl-radical enzyme activating protein n=1 Tax=Anaerostipes sp. TaxID=1872530 RepID=UPI0025BC00EA|nr:glycyl-radical enzyme activating protein [Anaerostipes sp.]
MDGRVFDIRRFSTHDGDGIRTTVFLKGCPLSCVWCQNPEGIAWERRPVWFENRCIGCSSCVHNSKARGVRMEGTRVVLDPNAPEDWNALADLCPSGALQMDSRVCSTGDVMKEIQKDLVFYRHGGGVTLSGGEPLFQWEFALEILKKCKEKGIHTAIETSLSASQDVLERLLPYLDSIFADFKIADDEKHRKYTGVSNQQIKKNLKFLLESDKKDRVTVRTPMIPGLTACRDNIKEIASYISGIYPAAAYEILNYNPLAEAKYHLIDKTFCFEENPKMYSNEQMLEFKQWAEEGGVKNVIMEL